MNCNYLALTVLLGLLVWDYPRTSAAVLTLSAPALFERSVTEHIQLTPDSAALELDTGELIEDDGPAAGHSYQKPKNVESVSGDTWIKKDLLIERSEAHHAYLVVLSESPFKATINGRVPQFEANQSGRQAYQTCAFDPSLLKPGLNSIVLRDAGVVPIARDDEFALGSRTRLHHPNRSAKSSDAGKTWDYDHLGPGGQLDGEYGVRLFLDHYRSKGTVLLPVLDAANLEGNDLAPVVTQLSPIHIEVGADLPDSSAILTIRVRSGPTYPRSTNGWSTWQTLGAQGGTLAAPSGRYFQIALDLATTNALQSPSIKSLKIATAPKVPDSDWTSRLKVVEAHNEIIRRTSIPFAYEPMADPRLKHLRDTYHLDQVVEGAQTEMDLMLRLAQWVCNSWDWPNHITEVYPPWNALEILKPAADGTPVGGFCQQFNLVFLQACESFGFVGRATSISQGRRQSECPGGGHEIVELWSNQFRKWVYVDGALAWYVTDAQSGTPLSMLELRERQLALLRGEAAPPVTLVDAKRTRNKQFEWNGLGPVKPLNWYLELRMIPRSNFLEASAPLPLNQGTEEWAWTGSYVWSDDAVPAGYLFGNRVSKRANFEWTLNQAHYVLEPEEVGVLRVHLDTETPSFLTFMAQRDGHGAEAVQTGFRWQLHSGRNQIRFWPKNVAGRDGIASWITIDSQ